PSPPLRRRPLPTVCDGPDASVHGTWQGHHPPPWGALCFLSWRVFPVVTSWLHRLLKKSGSVRKKVDRGRFLAKVESLDERVLPAITASFSAAGAILRVVGDAQDNTVVVSRDAAGTILVNGGAVAI